MFSRVLQNAARGVRRATATGRRLFSDHTAPHAQPGEFTYPKVKTIHKVLGEAMGTIMWLWIFYRAKEDGPALLGLVNHFEEHEEGHEHGAHADPSPAMAK